MRKADHSTRSFVLQMLPSVMKSAVQSANTVVFVPSSFDFIRVQNHFRKNSGPSFAVLSEYVLSYKLLLLGQRLPQVFFEPGHLPGTTSVLLGKEGVPTRQRAVSLLQEVRDLRLFPYIHIRSPLIQIQAPWNSQPHLLRPSRSPSILHRVPFISILG